MKISVYRILLMLLSVVLSIILWLYVMSVTDIESSKTIREIEVIPVGRESLTARNLDVIYHDQQITLTFNGRRTDLAKLDKNTVSVSVDVSDIIYADEYGVSLRPEDINFPEGVNRSGISVELMTAAPIVFFVDEMVRDVFKVKIAANIIASENYINETPFADPAEVTVRGPKTILSAISHAEVSLNEEGLDRTVERMLGYTLMDAGGKDIEDVEKSYISLERQPNVVKVTVPVHRTKVVELGVEFIDGGGITRDNVSYTVTPDRITLKGDSAVLEGLNSIPLGAIDLSKVQGSQSFEYPISLPNDCESLSGETEATVQIEITGVQTRSMNVTQIDHINGELPEGYEIHLITRSVTVQVRGPQNLVDSVEPHNVRVVVDLEGQTLTPGQMRTLATVYVDGYGSQVGAVGDYSVSLEIVPIPEDGGEEEP